MSLTYGNSVSPQVATQSPTLTLNTNTTLTAAAFGRSFKVTGAYTITLPAAVSGSSGVSILLMNDTSSSNVTLACQGSDFVRVLGANVATMVLSPGDSVIIQDTGTSFSLADSNTLKAPTNNPAFTGVPTAPTAAISTNTTQLATTAFVLNQASGLTPSAPASTPAAGSSAVFARGDHTHPTTAITQATADNSTNIATTAYARALVASNPSGFINGSGNTSGSAGSLNSASALPSNTTADTQVSYDLGTRVANCSFVQSATLGGYGTQTWTDRGPSGANDRLANTFYTNNTGRPIMILVSINYTGATPGLTITLRNPSLTSLPPLQYGGAFYANPTSFADSCSIIIPYLYSYSVTAFSQWYELR